MNKKILCIGCWTLFLFLLFSPFFSMNAVGSTTYYVDDDYNSSSPGWGVDRFNKIQDAIDNASSDDTISVNSGNYYENIQIDKSITLTGQNKDDTIIYGGDYDTTDGQAIVIPDGTNYVIISGFTVRSEIWQQDVVIRVWANKNIKIFNNIINKGKVGLSLSNTDGSEIYGNELNGLTGAGIYLASGSSNNLIYENGFINIIPSFSYSTVIFVTNCDENEIYDNDFFGNHGFIIDIQANNENNVIYNNNFIGAPGENGGYCCDEESNNFWYNSTLNQGNYWAVYGGSDSDDDGIGDTPFNINCSGGSQDLYPFMYQDGWSNIPPIADAGGSYIGIENVEVTLDGSGSTDDDGTIESYEWDLDNDDSYDDGTGPTIGYTWSNEGVYTISLKVTDDAGETDSDTTTVTISGSTPTDSDNDGILDGVDNCPFAYNPDQEDSDSDGVGDVCDSDLDGDGILNIIDNCEEEPNPDQEDSDSDGIGDVCDVPDQLIINSENEVFEKNNIEIIITLEGVPVESAYVTFKDTLIGGYTLIDGSIELTAPSVDEDTNYILNVSKIGYISAEKTINVKNQEIIVPILDGYINGVVYDKTSFQIIESAKVCVEESSDELVITKTCDLTVEGKFSFKKSPSNYIINTEKNGYKTDTQEISLSENEIINLIIILEKEEIEITNDEETTNSYFEYTIDEKIKEEKIGVRLDVTDKLEISNYIEGIIVEKIPDENSFSFSISAADGSQGTIILIYMGEGTLSNLDNIIVKYDDEKIEETTEVQSFFDMEGNPETSWLRSRMKNGLYLFIKIPEFSTHQISISSTIQPIIQQITRNIQYVVLIGIVILAAATVVTLRKSKD